MTVIQINIPDDLKIAFEQAFPGEPIPQVVERLIRSELAQRAAQSKAEKVSLYDSIRALAQEMKLTLSDDEIRKLRHEGRP